MSLSVYRNGQGEPLVLLHGWGMHSDVWGDILERLEAQYSVVRIDLPGHGNSGPEAATTVLDDWVDAVIAEAPENAIWAGWSLGAMIAIRAALRYPERVRALLAVTGTPCFMQRQDWPVGMAVQALQQFSNELLRDSQRTLLRFLSLQVRGAVDERATLKRLRAAIAALPAPSQQALDSGLHLLKTVDLREQLPGLTCPSLWLFGEKDTLVSQATADEIRNVLPHARILRIPGAGHAPFLSHPEVSLTALETLGELLAERVA